MTDFNEKARAVFGRQWQTALAEKAGVSQVYIHLIASGKRPPSAKVREALDKAAVEKMTVLRRFVE